MPVKKMTEQELTARMNQISKKADKLVADFNSRLQELKKKQNALLKSIQKRVDDDKIKTILKKIK